MCGIAGIIGYESGREAVLEKINAMTEIMSHRGPDDSGIYIDAQVSFGHRRLSILDLSSAGHQPMASFDGKYIIVFNGEIYNYCEIREELCQKGMKPFSNTDTEVVIEAYRAWGKDCVSKFNGMWAFAIYDKENGEIFLSRDRFGIKPLYYVHGTARLIFASEIKAILTAFQEERQPSYPTIHHFLPAGALDDGPETFFKNIYSLEPAHCAVFNIHDRTFKKWRYWKVEPELFRQKWITKDPIEMMWELLESSVRLHMRSDVPVGSCLSGGLDSSTIVCLMSRMRSNPIHTFSGIYSDSDCDERDYIAAVNEHANTVPRAISPEPGNHLVDDLARITWHQDEPTAGPGLYTQFYVMRQAWHEVKVILDGQGGDELFAGYIAYFGPHIKDLWHQGRLKNKILACWLLGEVFFRWRTEMLSLGRQKFGRMLNKATNKFLPREYGKRFKTAVPPFFHHSFLELMDKNKINRTHPQKFEGRLNNTLYLHLVQESIPALLHYEDRNSMAYSIEARVPFLDYRIVEFALGLDSSFKIKGSWTKWVLRQTALKVAPAKVALRRSKMGYPTPFARWLRESPSKDQAREIIFGTGFLNRNIVDKDAVRFCWQQHQSGIDRSWLLYRYLVLELWFQHFIDNFKPHPRVAP